MTTTTNNPSDLSSGIQVIQFGDGRLNPLGATTRQRLYTELQEAQANVAIKSIVLTGKGSRNFSAGADLTEFDQLSSNASQVISLVDLCHALEASKKPIVAAMEGVALGGGLELALSCHYRVASPHSKMGLPEVTVGVIPGAGGTQRLPRCIGFQKTVQLILSGKHVSAPEALKMGLVDALSNDSQTVLDCSKTWATWAALMPLSGRRLLERPLAESPAEIHNISHHARTKLPRRDRGGSSVHSALDALQQGCTLPPMEGMQKEAECFFQALAKGQGQRHAFFAVRAAQKSNSDASVVKRSQKHPLLSQPTSTHVGVVGAGTMGSGIALVLLQAGFLVHLVDIHEPALKKGVGLIQKIVRQMVTKRKISSDQATQLLQRLVSSTTLDDLSECQLVVEAVVENLQIKKKIFQKLEQVTGENAILVSNTSTLDVDAMAGTLSENRRGQFAGWHFFSPAHVMKLVEIVLSKETSAETVAILQALTKRIKKIGVTVGNCDGFVGNRMLHPYTTECVLMLADGEASVQSIDEALVDFGMALGPLTMSDLAGNDIGLYIRKERGWVVDPSTGQAPNRPRTMRYTELGDDLVTKLGRVGQKALKGWYDYDVNVGKGRKPLPSQEVSDLIQRYTEGAPKKKILSKKEIVERVLFPLVNVGFQILEEGIANQPSDVDVVYLYGYGWPSWRGGPLFWADHEVGLSYLLERLRQFAQEFPGSDYFLPSALLQKCVSMGVTVEEYYKRGFHKKNMTTSSRL